MSKYLAATVASCIAYHEERGREFPATADDADIEAALLVASEWVDNTYGASFVGYKVDGLLQEREWPRANAIIYDNRNRSYVFPTDVVPERVIRAVYEAAYRQVVSPGSLLVDYTPGKYKSVSVEGAVSVEYAQFSSAAATQTMFPIIDQILWPLLDTCIASVSSLSGGTYRA